VILAAHRGRDPRPHEARSIGFLADHCDRGRLAATHARDGDDTDIVAGALGELRQHVPGTRDLAGERFAPPAP